MRILGTKNLQPSRDLSSRIKVGNVIVSAVRVESVHRVEFGIVVEEVEAARVGTRRHHGTRRGVHERTRTGRQVWQVRGRVGRGSGRHQVVRRVVQRAAHITHLAHGQVCRVRTWRRGSIAATAAIIGHQMRKQSRLNWGGVGLGIAVIEVAWLTRPLLVKILILLKGWFRIQLMGLHTKICLEWVGGRCAALKVRELTIRVFKCLMMLGGSIKIVLMVLRYLLIVNSRLIPQLVLLMIMCVV